MYYSQHGQDKFIDEFFGAKIGGVFVEIGAHNGEAFSNTCFLERERQWTGLLVEPLPHCFEQMKEKRNCQMLNACISDKEGEEDFLYMNGWTEMLSGLVNSYDPKHKMRIDKEAVEYNCQGQTIKVKTYTGKKVFEDFNLKNIDYLSVDTEGSELQILQSIDFGAVNIKCISVENNYNDDTILKYLTRFGYRRIKQLGSDDIYFK